MFIDIPELRYMKEPEKSIAVEMFMRDLVTAYNRETEELKREIEEIKNGKKNS